MNLPMQISLSASVGLPTQHTHMAEQGVGEIGIRIFSEKYPVEVSQGII